MDDEFINPIGPVSKKRRNTSYVAKHNDEVSKIEAHEEHTLHLPDSTDQVLGENNAVYLHDQVNEQQIIKNPAEVPSMIAHQAQVFGDNIISSTSNALYMKNKGPNEAIEATAGVTTIGQSREILKSWFSQESDLCLQKTELLPQGDQEILSFNDLLHVLNQIQRYQQLEESNVDKKLSLSFAVKGAGNNIIYVLHELTTIVLANIYLLKNKRNEAKQEMNEELAQKKSKPLSHRSKNSIIKKYETKMFHADKTFDENLGLLKQEALLNFINFFNTIKMLLRDDTLPPSQEKVSKLDESEEPFRWSSVINRLRDTLNNFIEKIRKSEKKILSHKKIEEQQNIGSSSHSIPLIHQLTRSMQHANDAMIKFMAANQGNAEMEEAFLLTHLFLPDTLSQDTSLPEFCYDYEDKKKDVDRSPDSI